MVVGKVSCERCRPLFQRIFGFCYNCFDLFEWWEGPVIEEALLHQARDFWLERTLHPAIEPAPNKPCQLSCCCSELEPSALCTLFSLLSPLPPLFPLLSLLLISQIALRT